MTCASSRMACTTSASTFLHPRAIVGRSQVHELSASAQAPPPCAGDRSNRPHGRTHCYELADVRQAEHPDERAAFEHREHVAVCVAQARERGIERLVRVRRREAAVHRLRNRRVRAACRKRPDHVLPREHADELLPFEDREVGLNPASMCVAASPIVS
jgi:hypothetical protein